MVTVSTIRRRVRLLFLRWTILVRYHPNRAWIAGAVVIVVGIAASFWRFLYTSIPKWSERFGNSVLLLSQNHPHLSRIMHVILNAVPDAVPLFLGLAGLVYLMPNLAKRIEDSKPLRVIIATFCILFSILAIAVNAINREAQDHKSDEQNTQLATVETTNDRILKAVLNPSSDLSETERRRRIEDVLRNKYILTHSDVSPDVLAGTAWPPAVWMNQELASLHEPWKFTENVPNNPVVVQQITAEPKKAKVVFSFYQADLHSDNPKTVIIDSMENKTVTVSISAIVAGDIPAEDLHIWIRRCTLCRWLPVNASGFVTADSDHDFDKQINFPRMEPNIAMGKWEFSIQLPAFPKIVTVPFGCYYACDNCDAIDWSRPQVLWVTQSMREGFKMLSLPFVNTPEPVKK